MSWRFGACAWCRVGRFVGPFEGGTKPTPHVARSQAVRLFRRTWQITNEDVQTCGDLLAATVTLDAG